jgi:Tfp pilus assembly pilus retraction ATPase PilT
MLVKLKT